MLGAGVVHGLCIAALLPLLVSVPGPRPSQGGHTLVDIEVLRKAEPPKPAAATPKPEASIPAPAPEIVTGSIAPAAAALASAIAKMPREHLRQAEPLSVTLASVAPPPAANLTTDATPILVRAATAVARVDPASVEEIDARNPPIEPIKATDGDVAPETPASLARAEPAASTPESVRRKAVAPTSKAPAARAKPKARAPVKAKPAASPAPKKRAAPVQAKTPAARRPAQVRVRTTQQPLGLGLFFRKPPARQGTVRR